MGKRGLALIHISRAKFDVSKSHVREWNEASSYRFLATEHVFERSEGVLAVGERGLARFQSLAPKSTFQQVTMRDWNEALSTFASLLHCGKPFQVSWFACASRAVASKRPIRSKFDVP